MPAPTISLLFRHPSPLVRRAGLRRFLKELGQQILPDRDLSCLITTDQELQAFNREFRGKNYPTDVLSFPSKAAAEIAISYERAAAQAAELGHSVEDELKILILHGLLHLAGMDHETDSGQMARAEARWRKRLKLPESLTERALA